MSRGISLAELILSFFLLLLTVLLIFQLYPTAVSSVRISGQRSQANALAASVLAEYLDRPFSQLTLGLAPPRAAVPGRGTSFQPSVEILPVNQPGVRPERIRAIRVTVTWTDRGTERRVVREQWRTDVRR